MDLKTYYRNDLKTYYLYSVMTPEDELSIKKFKMRRERAELLKTLNEDEKQAYLEKERIEKEQRLIIQKREQSRRYYENHRNELNQKGKEKLQKLRETNPEKLEQMYQVKYEKHKDQYKEYRIKHIEEISKKRSQSFECECGAVIAKWSKTKHVRSSRHLEALQKKETK